MLVEFGGQGLAGEKFLEGELRIGVNGVRDGQQFVGDTVYVGGDFFVG